MIPHSNPGPRPPKPSLADKTRHEPRPPKRPPKPQPPRRPPPKPPPRRPSAAPERPPKKQPPKKQPPKKQPPKLADKVRHEPRPPKKDPPRLADRVRHEPRPPKPKPVAPTRTPPKRRDQRRAGPTIERARELAREVAQSRRRLPHPRAAQVWRNTKGFDTAQRVKFVQQQDARDPRRAAFLNALAPGVAEVFSERSTRKRLENERFVNSFLGRYEDQIRDRHKTKSGAWDYLVEWTELAGVRSDPTIVRDLKRAWTAHLNTQKFVRDNAKTTVRAQKEVESRGLAGAFLNLYYGNQPEHWTPKMARQILFDPQFGRFPVGRKTPPTRFEENLIIRYIQGRGYRPERQLHSTPGQEGDRHTRMLAASLSLLKHDMKVLAAQERRDKIKAITRTWYDTGVINENDELPGFGKVGKPWQLYKTFVEGTGELASYAPYLMQALMERSAFLLESDFRQWAGRVESLQRRLHGSRVEMQQRRTHLLEIQQRLEQEAIDDRPWWSDAFHGVMHAFDVTGDFGINVMQFASRNISAFIFDDPLTNSILGEDFGGDPITWEQQKAASRIFKQKHPILHAINQAVQDPANLFFMGAPVVVGSTVRSIVRLGLDLEATGLQLSTRGTLTASAQGVIYRTPAVVSRYSRDAVQYPFKASIANLERRLDDPVLRYGLGTRAYGLTKAATRQAKVAKKLAEARVQQVIYNGFRPISTRIPRRAAPPKKFVATDPDEVARGFNFGRSAIKDEAGNLKVVYHGTNQSFSHFSDELVGSRGSFHGRGHNFTDNPDLASAYANLWTRSDEVEGGQNIRAVYLNIQNPIYADQGLGSEVVENLTRMVKTRIDDVLNDVDIFKAPKTITDVPEWTLQLESLLEDLMPVADDVGLIDFTEALAVRLDDAFTKDEISLMIRDALEMAGYDGIVYRNDQHFIRGTVEAPDSISRWQTYPDEEFLQGNVYVAFHEHQIWARDIPRLDGPVDSPFPNLYEEKYWKFSKEDQAMYDAAERVFDAQSSVPQQELFDLLVKHRMSLFAEAGKRDLSDLGVQMYARFAEDARAYLILRLADRAAMRAQERWHDRFVRKHGYHPTAEQLHNVYMKRYRREAAAGGSYYLGFAAPHIEAEINPLHQELLSFYRNVYLPSWQRNLERAWEGKGGLWDEHGKWVGRGQSMHQDLNRVVGHLFDEMEFMRIKNPNYRRLVPLTHRIALEENEVERLVTRFEGYVARKRALGDKQFTDDWIEEQIQARRDHVHESWRQSPQDGRWYDSREYLSVPRAYARQYTQFFAQSPGHLMRMQVLEQEMLSHLRNVVHPDDFEDARRIASAVIDSPRLRPARVGEDAVAGVRESTLAIDTGMADRINTSFGSLVHWFDGSSPFVTQRILGSTDLRDLHAVESFQKALRELATITDHLAQKVLPFALKKEWALWQALQHAKSIRMRALYTVAYTSLALWRLAVLPLRPGWVVRNTVDNWFKAMIIGITNPAAWARGATVPGRGTRTLFETVFGAVDGLLEYVEHWDVRLGTSVAATMRAAMDEAWHTIDTKLLGQLFDMHGIPMPETNIVGMTLAKEMKEGRWHNWDEMATEVFRKNPHLHGKYNRAVSGKSPAAARAQQDVWWWLNKHGITKKSQYNAIQRSQATLKTAHDNIWKLMGERPEAYWRRVIFRNEFVQAKKAGWDDLEAFKHAWGRVEHTLFDYSKITVIEQNLRWFAPFIQFWRKNTMFWLETFVKQPRVPINFARLEQGLEDQHADWAEWQRRYITSKEVSDLLDRVPGMGWLAAYVADADFAFDPTQILSFAPLWRAFKAENMYLAPENQGMAFISSIVDAMNDWGLTLNPLFRKPLEWVGILNFRAWQTILPQENLLSIFSRKFWSDRFPMGLNIDDLLANEIFKLIGKEPPDSAAQNFEYYVRLEVAGQIARGEDPDYEQARKTVTDYFLVQGLVGYFGGIFARRMTSSDYYLAGLAEDMHEGSVDFLDLTNEQRLAYRTFRARNWDATQYNRYLEMIPLIRTYYQLDNWVAAQNFLYDNPEILPFVEEGFGKLASGWPSFIHLQLLSEKTQLAFDMWKLFETLDLPFELVQAANKVLITRELQEFWDRNNTNHELRMKQLRGQWNAYLNKLNQGYWAIPETDRGWADRAEYLKQHPQLLAYWHMNNSGSDDTKVIYDGLQRAYRERYFEFLRREDFDGAVNWLQSHPFIWEDTKYEDKYRRIIKLGRYPGSYVPGKYTPGGYSRDFGKSEHARDYLKAKPYLDHFFDLMNDKGKDAAFAWLNRDGKAQDIVRAYFREYGDGERELSQHAKDYLKAKDALKYYFRMRKNNPEAASIWLRGNSKMARIVRKYFDKYADPSPKSQRAKDYLRVKNLIAAYFAISEDDHEARQRYLNNHPALLAYFNKYAEKKQLTEHAKDYLAVKDLLTRYFALPMDDRGAFLDQNPQLEAYFDKYADEQGMSQHAEDYLRMKETIDFYFRLKYNHGSAYARNWLNSEEPGAPELRDYFAKYSDNTRLERQIGGRKSGQQYVLAYVNGYLSKIQVKHRRRQYFSPRNSSQVPFTARQMDFWYIYFNLPPDQRVLFLHEQAENYGVEAFGPIGATERRMSQEEWIAGSYAMTGNDSRSQLFARVRPLVEYYVTLNDDDRRQFIVAYPELGRYVSQNAGRISGDLQIDRLLFEFAQAPDKARFWENSPDLQRWIRDPNSQEAQRLAALLLVYLALPGPDKDDWILLHPEIGGLLWAAGHQNGWPEDTGRETTWADLLGDRTFDQGPDGSSDVLMQAWLKKREIARSRYKEIVELKSRREREPTVLV